MSENIDASKNKKTISNIVYSFLVFIASCDLLVAILDPTALTHPSIKERSAGAFIGLGVGIVITIAFSRWYSKKNSR